MPTLASLAERLRLVEVVLELERRFGVSAERLSPVAVATFGCARDLERLHASTSAPSPRLLARIDGELESAERLLATIDASVPVSSVRPVLRRGGDGAGPEVPEALIVLYARFLILGFRPNAEATQKVDYVAHRLLTCESSACGAGEGTGKGAGRTIVVRPREEVRALLDDATRGVKVDAAARDAALAFFRGALAKIEAMGAVDEFFDTGFCLDASGYKVALRESLLDPEVLYACTEMNAALANKFSRLIASERLEEGAVRKRLEQVRAVVNQVFASDTEEVADEGPRRPAEERPGARIREELSAPTVDELAPRPMSWGARIAIAVLLVAGIGLLLGAWRSTVRNQNELVPVPEANLSELSPLLEGGSFSRGAGETVFIGKLASARWRGMKVAERRREAKELASSLVDREVMSALIYDGSAVAVQIMRGKAMYVE